MEINIGSIVLEDELNFGNIKLDTVKVYPELENIEITPSKEEQTFKSENYYGYDEVKVNGVTNEIDKNIVPENIKEGVEILGVSGNVEEVNTTEISINPSDTEQVVTPEAPYNGFSKVTVGAQSGINPDEYFNGNYTSVSITGVTSGGWRNAIKKMPKITIPSNITNLTYFFAGYMGEELPYFDTSNVTNMYNFCRGASNLKIFPNYNMSKVMSINNIFYSANNLVSVGELDGSSLENIKNAFSGTKNNFTDFGGIKNLGKAYNTSYTANTSEYTLGLATCSNLTHDSLINVINGLYDIASIGVQPQQLVLGSTNLAKLNATEEGQQAIASAQNKGWTVS